MADEKRWKGGRLGPFHIGRRYKDKEAEVDLGRIYEARNMHTGAAALVLIPGGRADWEPGEAWQVRASSQVEPPYVALEVEQAPASGQLPELAEVLDLLTSAVEGLAKKAEVRTHLTRESVGLLKRWTGRLRRGLRSRRLLAAVPLGLAALGLALALSLRTPEPPEAARPAASGVAVEALDTEQAPPLLLNKADVPPGTIAYSMPKKPFKNQAKAPCKSDEVEINGGCWVEIAKRPPCNKDHAEYQGKCYLPISADRSPPVPEK